MSDVIRRELSGNVVVLHLQTDSIDAVSAEAIEAACTDMKPITVLDFSDVSFINSAGISVLLKFAVKVHKEGHRIFAMNLTPHHQKIFKMVEMSRYMPTIEERELADYRASNGSA